MKRKRTGNNHDFEFLNVDAYSFYSLPKRGNFHTKQFEVGETQSYVEASWLRRAQNKPAHSIFSNRRRFLIYVSIQKTVLLCLCLSGLFFVCDFEG